VYTYIAFLNTHICIQIFLILGCELTEGIDIQFITVKIIVYVNKSKYNGLHET
jgi:hypothetical protein